MTASELITRLSIYHPDTPVAVRIAPHDLTAALETVELRAPTEAGRYPAAAYVVVLSSRELPAIMDKPA